MKFTPSRQTVISSNETKSFSMAVNAKSFSILTSGIYQDKIKAVIREYSTNAVDAHIQVGNTQPFDVHLPTEKELYFYVRDYGSGLDQNGFENVFCTFFESTKDNRNDVNGMLGLGSKSAYSYNSKSFTAECYLDGKCRIYSCFIGGSGIPEYTLLLESETKEPNGVKIQFAVNKNDISRFEDTAEELYKWFTLKPNFIGKKITLENPYLEKKKHYAISSGYNGGCLAVMGNVAYPIDHNHELSKYSSLIKSNIILFFDIGEISFTPSRESLEYSDRTLKNIKIKFEETLKEIKEYLESTTTNCKTEWEAISTYNKEHDLYSRKIPQLRHTKSLTFDFNGKLLSCGDLKVNPDEVNVTLFNPFSKHRVYQKDIYISGNYTYVLNDLKTGQVGRCKKLSNDKNINVYLFNQDFLDSLDITYDKSAFVLASTLPKPIVNKSASSRSSLGDFRKMKNHYSLMDAWEEADVKDAKSNIYVIRNQYRPIFKGAVSRPCDLYRKAEHAGIKSPIYAVTAKFEEDVKKLGFIPLEEAIKNSVDKIKSDVKMEEKFLQTQMAISVFVGENSKVYKNISEISKKFDISKTEIFKVLDIKKENEKNQKKYLELSEKLEVLRNSGENFVIKPDYNITSSYKKLVEKYDLLNSDTKTSYYYSTPTIKTEHLYYYILGVEHAV